MPDFDKDPRRQQELRGRPFADAIYRATLNAQKITRSEDLPDKWDHLDKWFGIDTHIRLPDGQGLTVQEKFLSYECARFNSLTVEYEQNQHTGEKGDWFRLLAHLYFIAYFNESGDGFGKWGIVDIAKLKVLTQAGSVEWHDQANKDGRALASFKWCDVGRLPRECVMWQSGFHD